LDGRENSDTIPTDLIIEILSRLLVKSIGRCRCVSKLIKALGPPHFAFPTSQSWSSPDLQLARIYCSSIEEKEIIIPLVTSASKPLSKLVSCSRQAYFPYPLWWLSVSL
ncbi:unnamed protein product, partial [Brassica rapa subsp. trilocularis]